MLKRLLMLTVVVTMMVALLPMAGVSYAQDDPTVPPRPDRPTIGQALVHRLVIEVAAEALGISPRELHQMAEEDQTLNDLLALNGIDATQVAANAKTRATDAINEALASDRLPQERVDEMLAELDTLINDALNMPMRVRNEPPVNPRMMVMETAAAALGVEVSEVLKNLSPDQSLSEYLSANGVDPNQVIADATAAITADVTAAVAEGSITQEQADAVLGRLDETINNVMNFVRGEPLSVDPVRTVLDMAAAALGVDVQAMLQGMESGQTLRDYLTANGIDPNQVAADATTAITEAINAAVSEGKLDQERADRLLGNLDSLISGVLDRQSGGRFGDGRVGNPAQTVIETAAAALGIDVQTMLQGLAGQSIADYLTANGADPNQVAANAKAAITEGINTAVANGDITQEQADRQLENLDTLIDRLLNANPRGRLGERGERGQGNNR